MSKFFNYLATPDFRKQAIIAFTVVVILVFTLFISLRFYTRHAEGKPVPNFKGLNIEKAVELLKQEGFRYQIDSVFILDKPAGLVTEQDPDANTNVKENRMIYLTIVSSQTPDVILPDIADKTFIEVKAMLTNYGLKLGDTSYQSDIAKDAVLSFSYAGQKLKVGQKIPKGSRIDLVLGDGYGASEVDLPNLVGLTLGEARFSLKGASLTLGDLNYEGVIRDSANAIIKRQYPEYGLDSINKVGIGTRINLVLSNE